MLQSIYIIVPIGTIAIIGNIASLLELAMPSGLAGLHTPRWQMEAAFSSSDASTESSVSAKGE